MKCPSLCRIIIIWLSGVVFLSSEFRRVDAYDVELSGPVLLPAIGLVEQFQFSPLMIGTNDFYNGKWSYRCMIRWINIWAYNMEDETSDGRIIEHTQQPYRFGSYMVDMETMCITNCFSYGFENNGFVLFAIPLYQISGGILDGFIESVHDMFDINQHKRDRNQKDTASIFFVEPNGEENWIRKSTMTGTYFGNVSIYSGMRVRDKQPAVTLQCGIKLPTNTLDHLPGQDGCDMALITSSSWKWSKSYWYQGIGLTYYSKTGYKPADFKKWRLQTATTLELPVTNDVSVIGHLVANSPAADYPNLDENVMELSVGTRIYQKNYKIDLALIENLFWFDNSPDFGIYCEIKRLF